MNRPVIAIDGPSGSGKSSTSRGVATRLGLRYLDTGAMFRAVTLWALEQGVELDRLADRLDGVELVSGTDPANPTISLGGVDVSTQIRSDEVNSAVSPVSAIPEVRTKLLELQRELIGQGGIVVEGRDIGSVVWPQAELKIYLSADPAARAARRAAESGNAATSSEAALLERDRIDSSRAVAPLKLADGAVHVDGTYLSLDGVIDRIVSFAEGLA